MPTMARAPVQFVYMPSTYSSHGVERGNPIKPAVHQVHQMHTFIVSINHVESGASKAID